jgi:hypothetical protein
VLPREDEHVEFVNDAAPSVARAILERAAPAAVIAKMPTFEEDIAATRGHDG